MKTAKWIALALTLTLGGTRPAWVHGEDDQPQARAPEQLGEVDFPVSCNTLAGTQRALDATTVAGLRSRVRGPVLKNIEKANRQKKKNP